MEIVGFIVLMTWGVEPTGLFYAQECNVMGEILLSRYEIFLKAQGQDTCYHQP